MRQLHTVVFCFGVLLSGCTRGGQEVNQRSVQQLEAISGMKFPADTEVLYQGGSGRKGEAFREYVMRTRSAFAPPNAPGVKIPVESVAATISRLLPAENMGKVIGAEASVNDWTIHQHGWRASVLETSDGRVMHLEDLGN